MHQVETLVCGVSVAGTADSRVSCETLITTNDSSSPPPDPDLPPDSITIPLDSDTAYSDVNPIYDRDDSTKGSTNPKSNLYNPIKTRSNSARLATAAPIIVLPAKIRPGGNIPRRRPLSGRLLHNRRSDSGGGGGEPGSPKVSCIGKVLSDRERRRRRCRPHDLGCWGGLVALFKCGGGGSRLLEDEEEEEVPTEKKVAVAKEEEEQEERPGLGAMRRFASRRRSASWGDEVVEAVEDGRDGAWGRRSVGPLGGGMGMGGSGYGPLLRS